MLIEVLNYLQTLQVLLFSFKMWWSEVLLFCIYKTKVNKGHLVVQKLPRSL